jgi:NADH-quinone oxidoreductase subunit J
MLKQVLFWTLAFVSVGSALLVITRKNAIYSALFLVVCFFSIAGLYLMLNAQFVAAVQVIVYAGAIMVLFLFAVMLLQSGRTPGEEHTTLQTLLGWVLGFVLAAQVVMLIFTLRLASVPSHLQVTQERFQEVGNTEMIGYALYSKYIYPFEAVSVLLLISIIGAVMISKKNKA